MTSFSGGFIRTRLTAPDGSTVFTSTDSSLLTADEGPLTLTQTGTYNLSFEGVSGGTPTYAFQINLVPPPDVTPIVIDQVYAGAIEGNGFEDHWTFDGVIGQEIYVDTQTKTTGSLTAKLIAPDGSTVFSRTSLVASSLDAGPFVIDQVGTYSLQYSEPGGGTPQYSFRVWDVAPRLTAPLPLGEIISGQIETPGTTDTLTFDGTAGTRIFLDMQQIWQSERAVNETLRSSLIAPSGAVVFSNFDFLYQAHDVGPIELAETGVYSLVLSGGGDNIPGYQLRIDDVTPAPPTSIAIGDVVSDAIDVGGRTHAYTFSATVGTDVTLDMLFNEVVGFNPPTVGATITSPSGAIVVGAAFADTTFTAAETGLYTIVVDDRGFTRLSDITAKYSFRLLTDPAMPAPAAADLVVSSVVADAVSIGNPAEVTVTWTVTNAGTAAADPWSGDAWVDQIMFSADETAGGRSGLSGGPTGVYERVFGEVVRSEPLLPGQSYTQTATITMPADFEGSFWVYVQADATNQVYEAEAVTNNQARSDRFSAVYRADRPVVDGPPIRLAPPEGSRYPVGTDLALAGSVGSTRQSVNVVFMIDVSTSTLSPSGLDVNGDGVVDDRDDVNNFPNTGDVLDAEIAAALRVVEQLQLQSDDVKVATVLFAGGSEPLDAGPEPFNQGFVDPSIDTTYRDDRSNFDTAITSLWSQTLGFVAIQGAFGFRNLQVRQGTEFEPVMRDVENLLATSQPADRTLVYLLTDGVALDTNRVGVQGVADRGVEFYAFQIGNNTLTPELARLTADVDADPTSTGLAIAVDDPAQLSAQLLTTIDVESVTVNGVPVDALDAAGNFFAGVTLAAGANTFDVVATTAAGTSTQTTLTLFGDAPGTTLDLASLLPAADGLTATFAGTTYNRNTDRLHTSIAVTNGTADTVSPPITAVLENFSTPTINVLDSTLAPLAPSLPGGEGSGVRGLVTFNSTLPIDATSTTIDLTFANPSRDRFDFDVRFLTTDNSAPVFAGVPVLLAAIDTPYSYTAAGFDADGDSLTTTLLQAPASMTLVGNTLTWTPTASDVGHHSVQIQISDSRGGVATQQFTMLVPSGLANNPPLILGTPGRFATVDEPFQYTIVAADPEGSPVTLSLDPSLPAGVVLSGRQLTWTPDASQTGVNRITVLATDSQGAVGRQSFDVRVLGVNTPPTFVTDPVAAISAGQTYFYAARAIDTEDTLTYSIAAPTGVTIGDTSGVVSWPATLTATGDYPVTITATDARGLSTDQSYTLSVSPDAETPRVSILLSSRSINLGQSIDVQVVASDNVAVASTALFVDGVPVTLDANGRVTLTPIAAGIPRLTATATDTTGNVGSTGEAFFVVDPADVTPPTVAIESPISGATIEYLADVIGTATDDALASWSLEASLIHANQWRTIASASVIESGAPVDVASGLLGVFDPTLLKNNQYQLRLTASDIAGNTSTTSVLVGLDGQAKIGVNVQPIVDLTIPVAGGPAIEISRTHSQLTADEAGDFGNGWSFCSVQPDLRETPARTPFENLLGQFAAVSFREGDKVYITAPDCQRVGFTFSPTPHTGIWTEISDSYFDPRWIPDPGVDWRLYGENDFTTITSLTTGEFDVDGLPLPLLRGPDNTFFIAAVNASYNPLGYELVNKQGVRYSYDQETGLESVIDRNGNTLQYGDDGITSSSGQQVQFQRDAQGRITAVIDPDGNQIDYSYDAAGNLVDVAYPNGLGSNYRYTAQNYLDAVNPEDSVQDVATSNEFVYDVAGRLQASINANAEATAIAYDLINRRQVITDPENNFQTVEYDDRGNVTKQIDSVGDVVTMSYDADDNMTSVTNGIGATTNFQYDARRNLLALTDPLGKVTSFTYNAQNDPLSTTDPLGRTVSFGYDQFGNQTSLTDPTGATGTIQYDGFGRATSVTDVAGRTVQFIYEPGIANPVRMVEADGAFVEFAYSVYGDVTSLTDYNGNVTLTARDTMGRILGVTDALGNSSTIVFTGRNPEKQIDHLGRETAMLYDSQGRLLRITDPDGNVTGFEYNRKGMRTKTIDPLGREARMTYRPDGTIASVTDAIGNVTRYAYDGMKNLTSVIDANGNQMSYEYDLRSDLLAETDGVGNRIEYELDDARRLTAMIDPRGGRTSYVYDVRNNLTEMVDALGNSSLNTYDVLGNLATQRDRNGNVTAFEYDVRNRTTRIVDAAGGSTTFAYDDYGNRTNVTDANGNSTSFQYDALLRLSQSTDANGSTESWNFNDAGLVSTYIDQLGRSSTFNYDVLNRLTAVSDPLGQTTTFTYDAVGNRTSQSDALGRTTQFNFDSLNRIRRVVDPTGAATTRSYDPVGNLVGTTDPQGEVIQRTYDAANRLVALTDALNQTSQFSYDANGNRTLVTDALGHTTDYTFDALNRLIAMKDARGNSASFAFDLHGNRTALIDETGNQTTFVYDSLNRLVQTTDPLGNASTNGYDAVGNLVQHTDRLGRVRAMQYDSLNRLTTERWLQDSLEISQFSYSYDATGNLVTATGPNSTYAFDYDSLNRIAQVDNAGSIGPDLVLAYAYDAVGNRISVTDNSGVSVQTDFDGRNLPTAMRWAGGTVDPALLEMDYDARGQNIAVRRFADLSSNQLVSKTLHEFDAKGRLTQIQHLDALDSALADFDYGFDAVDRLVAESGGGDATQYVYDEIGQIVAADSDVRADENYQYDASGNRIDSSNVLGSNNRLLADASFDYAYDFDGNLVSKIERSTGIIYTFDYDHRNRLTDIVVTSVSGVVLSSSQYVYDIFDRRIAIVVDRDGDGAIPSTTTFTVYEGENAWADADANGQIQSRYLFGDQMDQIYARWTSTEGTAWYLTDHLGSIREIVDAAGATIHEVSYDSFGNIVSELNPQFGDRFKFTGREFDQETGNYYYRARYYDPSSGRFLSEDTIGFSGGDSNLYRYVANSPTNATDPSGNIEMSKWLIGFGVGGSTGLITGLINGTVCGYFEEWARVISTNRAVGERVEPSELFVNLDDAAWGRVAFKAAQTGGTASIFGGLIGAAFSMFTPPNFMAPVGIAAGFLGGAVPLLLQNEKIDSLVKNRENRPEELFSHMVCIATEVGTGELGGAFAGAILRNVLKSAGSVRPPDIEAPNLTAPAVGRIDYPPTLSNPLGGRLKGDKFAIPGNSDDVMVIGSRPDTRNFVDQEGYNVLNVADEAWNIDVNDGWMARGILEGRKFELASPILPSTLRRVENSLETGTILREKTVFLRELKQLRDAGYIKQGNTMVPGPNWKGL